MFTPTDTSTDLNRTITRRYGEDIWSKGDMEAIDELFDKNAVDHNGFPGQAPGSEGQKQVVTLFRSAFPDLRINNDDILAEGDKAVLRWTARGTHKGELMGIGPTGKQITMTGIDILRIVDGKIVERWGEYDGMGLMQQLGVVPAPGQ